MDINRRSNLFQEVEDSVIRKIFLEKLHITQVLSIELISGGMFNTTYKIECGQKAFVIRFSPINEHLVTGFEKHLMAAENFVYSLCRKHQIICPEVVVCDTTRKLLHTDLWEGNVIIAYQNKTPFIKAIIDCDRAVFGDIDFEWAAPWMDIPGIYKGAGIHKKEFMTPHRKTRRQIYRIFYALMNCYVGAYEYCDMDMFSAAKKEIQNVL